MKHKVGDKLRITDVPSFHEFKTGETVIIAEVNEVDGDYIAYKEDAYNPEGNKFDISDDNWWWVGDHNLEPLEE